MKKFLYLALNLFFLALFLKSAVGISAGTNSCNFVPQTGCNVANTNCDQGEVPNFAYCQGFDTQADCNNAPPTNCLPDPVFANCGSAGESCCIVGGSPQCDGGLKCQNKVCQACGGQGQQCCQSGALACNISLFCDSSNTCTPAVIPSGCRLINSTLGPCTNPNITCTNNPSYCCPDQSSCSQLEAPVGENKAFVPSGPTLCGDGTGIPTAIGCIPTGSPQAFAEFFLKWGMGIAGGLALALIGYSGFMIMSSKGDPQKLQAGKELLTGAISGLMLLLFGVFALRFIGIDILGLNQFGFGPPGSTGGIPKTQ